MDFLKSRPGPLSFNFQLEFATLWDGEGGKGTHPHQMLCLPGRGGVGVWQQAAERGSSATGVRGEEEHGKIHASSRGSMRSSQTKGTFPAGSGAFPPQATKPVRPTPT